ncbi:MAG: 30S ribosomal protein S3 [Pseudomonadota bacterium]
MGQKVDPRGIRLGIVRRHTSIWYASPKNYAKYLLADIKAREFIKKKLKSAAVSDVIIERPSENAHITIKTARPGVVIEKKGEGIERLRQDIAQILRVPVHINIEEIRKPEIEAQLVADSISSQLERRVMFRRAIKRAVQAAIRAGAEGIKVQVGGRLGGAEIARTEWYREKRVPLHTFRADIDYATSRAETTYGTIGVKVWIFKGERLGKIDLTGNDNASKKSTPAA